MSKLWLSLRVTGKTQTCVSRRHTKQEKQGHVPRALSVALCSLLPRLYLHTQRPWWQEDLGLILAPWLPTLVNTVTMIKHNLLCVRTHSTCPQQLMSLISLTLHKLRVLLFSPNHSRGNGSIEIVK